MTFRVNLPRFANARYSDLRRVHTGSLYEVYRATDLALNRRVAIKLPVRGRVPSPKTELALFREARALATVASDHVVDVIELLEGFPTTAGFALVLQLHRGTSADRLVEANGGALPVATALHLGVQAAMGLADLHSAGIVHNNVRLDNILIGSAGTRRMRVKLAGMSRSLSLSPLGDGGLPAAELLDMQTADARALTRVVLRLLELPAIASTCKGLRGRLERFPVGPDIVQLEEELTELLAQHVTQTRCSPVPKLSEFN